jgi:hypothetical protein
MMTLRLNRETIDLVRHADESLATAFERTAEWGGSPDVEIVLRKKKYSREPLPDRIRSAVRRWAGSEDVRHGATAFRVSGLDRHTGEVNVVDVLKSDLVATRRILRAAPRLRALDDELHSRPSRTPTTSCAPRSGRPWAWDRPDGRTHSQSMGCPLPR